MPTYRTPGVYVEEISTLPPSVAEVSTAIPAFLGYTQRGSGVARISTLLEFEKLFGGPNPSEFTVTTRPENDSDPSGPRVVKSITRKADGPEYLLHHAVSLYFKNGGGSCYIASVGHYGKTPTAGDFTAGLDAIAKEDEPTLIVLGDAVNLKADDYNAVCQAALAQCAKLGDRFAILDVKDGDVGAFRSGVGANNLMYGAAYHPYLQTTLTQAYDEGGVKIVAEGAGSGGTDGAWARSLGDNGVNVSFSGAAGADPTVAVVEGDSQASLSFAVNGRGLTITNTNGRTGAEIASGWDTWKAGNSTGGFELAQAGDGSGAVAGGGALAVTVAPTVAKDVTLADIKGGDNPETRLYSEIQTALAGQRVILPPSAAVAGVYAQVDGTRGVWKAPANVGVSSVVGPVVRITHDEQEGLNVDANAGKSINAIRAFSGKGTLIWGARTLAGNDNEWRYVPVRRLFITVEESIQKATSFAVFEPNDSTTWLKLKGMIESYLYSLWEQGALAGSSPDAAYFVNVGLGQTMTAQDVLEGRMIIKIGLAAVRPAEFIILQFTHKLQEA